MNAQWNHLKIVTTYTWGLKQKQYFLSDSTSCQKGPLLEENIRGSSVEINVNELSLPSEIPLKIVTLYTWGLEVEAVILSASTSCQKGPLPAENFKGSSAEINVNELSLPSEIT